MLSNSLGTTLYMWEDQVPALAEHFTLIRYDTRGHGESEIPPGPYTLDDLGQDVIDLLDHLEIARANVAGLSLGGMTAMWLGIHAPERVEKLALLCTSPRMGPPGDVGRAHRHGARAGDARRSPTRRSSAGSPTTYDDQHAIDWLRETFIGIDDEGYANCCHVDPAHGPDRQPRRHRGPDARDRRRPGPGDAAGRAREEDRRRASPARGWRSSTGAHLINVEQSDEVVRPAAGAL